MLVSKILLPFKQRLVQSNFKVLSHPLSNPALSFATKTDKPNTPHLETTKLASQQGNIPLVKRLVRARIASNREAQELVESGKVSVNKIRTKDPLQRVSFRDKVYVAGHGLLSNKSVPTKLFLAHKLRGELLARQDNVNGRKLFFDRIENRMGVPRNLISVGHLDYNSDGLVVLTNNGLLSDWLSHPSSEMPREYKAKVWSRFPVDAGLLAWFSSEFGIQVGCTSYQPLGAEIATGTGKRDQRKHKREQKGAGKGHHTWLNLTLHDGKRHQVREILSSAGMVIKELSRTSYGPFKLGDIPPGAVLELKNHSVLDKAIPTWKEDMKTHWQNKRRQ